MTRRWYGSVPDRPDLRDFLFRVIRPRLVPLPPNVDLRALTSPVRDQGELGSCSGFSLAVGLREFLEKKAGEPLVQMSPLFVYYEERALEHSIKQDSGAQLRDGLKVLVAKGCSPEADDPYNVSTFTRKPSRQALKDAKAWRIASYHRLIGLDEMRTCLASGMGFAMGFVVYESFESDGVAQTGFVPMPEDSEQIVGGHAVFVCGYQTDPKAPGGGWLIVKNSWGDGWGDHGFFYLPYSYVTPDLVSDSWTGIVSKDLRKA